jgi:hypothetical protein
MPECLQIHNCGRETPQSPASDKAANLLRELPEEKKFCETKPQNANRNRTYESKNQGK